MRRFRDPFATDYSPGADRLGGVVSHHEADSLAMLPVVDHEYLGSRLPAASLRWFVVVGGLGLALLLSRMAILQLVEGSYYRGLAEGNRLRLLDLPAQRGLFFDRFGQPLVRNDPNLRLEFVPVDLQDDGTRASLVAEVAAISGLPVEAIAGQLRDPNGGVSYQPVVLAEGLTHDQAIRTSVLASRAPSIRLGLASQRRYLHAGAVSLSHVLGYLGKITPEEVPKVRAQGYALTDLVGRSGLELVFEDVVRGVMGREQIEVDAIGQRKERISYQAPTAGADITLTIDLAAQQALEAALRAAVPATTNHGAAAVAQDPNSGEILALVSLPTFDSNSFARGIAPAQLAEWLGDLGHPLFNRVTQGTYPSGSTIKLVVAAAALEAGVVHERTSILSTGGIRVGQWYFPDWKVGGHGPTNVTLALAESVNTYFYYLGGGYKTFAGLGVERLTKSFRHVGLGAPLGVGLPSEAAGLVPDPAWKLRTTGEPWYIGDTYHLAIGQGDVLVTPLQVANYTAIIANGGVFYRPHLVREIRTVGSPIGQRQAAVVVTPRVFTPELTALVRRGLRRAVVSGSARALGRLPLSVAGKTGTAQWAKNKKPHAWFTGYAPADNPRVVLTVLVEEGGEGSEAAVPVAARFLTWWAEHRNLGVE